MHLRLSGRSYESPSGCRYDPAMAKVEHMTVEEARKVLGRRVDRARDEDVHTAVTKHGRTIAVVVPLDWYRQAREAVGDPTDL
jgi:prevent-host-death family protein